MGRYADGTPMKKPQTKQGWEQIWAGWWDHPVTGQEILFLQGENPWNLPRGWYRIDIKERLLGSARGFRILHEAINAPTRLVRPVRVLS